MSNASKVARMEALDKEIAELIKGDQEGSEVIAPTQSAEEVKPESSEETPKVITEQPAAKEIKAEEGTLEYWKDRCIVAEQRYNTSKPKYDSNIYKLKQENVQLQQGRIALQKALNEARQELTSKQGDQLDTLFDKQTVDVLGQKTVDAIKQSIKDTNDRVSEQEKSTADAKVAANEAKISNDIQTGYDTFIASLTRIVPDQAALNTDPAFLKFLGGVDELTGAIRFDLLSNAERSRDVGRVAQFFLEYKKTLVKPVVKDSVNKRIAPSQDGSTSVQDITDAGKVTVAFVEKFYNDVTHGLYKGRREEQMKIEAQIDQAFISGNMVG